MNSRLPPAQRKVVLRLAGGEALPQTPSLSTAELDQLLERARAAGVPLHHDAQIAALLASLRLRDDVPALLYAAAAAVLACIYETAQQAE